MKRLRDTSVKKLNSIVQFTGMETIPGRLAQGGFLRGDLSEIVECDPMAWAWAPLGTVPSPRWSTRQEPLTAEKNARHFPRQHRDGKISPSSILASSPHHLIIFFASTSSSKCLGLLICFPNFHICQPLKSGATYNTSQHWSCIKRRTPRSMIPKPSFSSLIWSSRCFSLSLFHVFSH